MEKERQERRKASLRRLLARKEQRAKQQARIKLSSAMALITLPSGVGFKFCPAYAVTADTFLISECAAQITREYVFMGGIELEV